MVDKPFSDFGCMVREARLQQNMSQRDLGAAASLNFTYISKLERGTVVNPSRNAVRRIALALNAPVDKFEEAAGYMPKKKRTLAASRHDSHDNSLPPDVLLAIEVIKKCILAVSRDDNHDNSLPPDVSLAIEVILNRLRQRDRNEKVGGKTTEDSTTIE